MKPTLTACLVIYNEEKILERCLSNISSIVDEIIVVHDGECSDRSLEIAKKYGAKIYVREHGGSCEKHRVFSFEQASSNWILMIDADEFLSKGLKKSIKKLIESKKYDAYAFRWPIFDGKEYVKGVYENKVKVVLAKKSQMYYIAITHESLATYGRLSKRMDLLLEHRPIQNSFTVFSMFKKLFKWGRIQAKEIVELENAPMFNMRVLEKNKHYKYYKKLRSHPIYMTLKLIIYDSKNTLFIEKGNKLNFSTIKIFLIKQLTYLYLGYRVVIEKVSPNENKEVSF